MLLPFGVILLLIIFAGWNFMAGNLVLIPLSYLMRCEYDRRMVRPVICGPWIVGLLLPLFYGYTWRRATGVLIFFIGTVALPYGFLIYARLSCFTTRLYFESEEGEESEPVSVEDYESLLILKKVLSEENKEEEGGGDEEKIDAKETNGVEQKPTNSIQRLFSKTKTKKDNSKTEQETDEENQSFGAKHPKEDIYVTSHPKEEEAEASEVHHSTTNTDTTLCAICIDEYSVGQVIAWSRNPNCHHVFHKDCIMECMKRSLFCPICRENYNVKASSTVIAD